jgi:hypothetical protein
LTLDIDASRPLRTVARLRELVGAIRDADPATQETQAVEWKGEIDLTEKRWQAEMARQVLGFSNRDPDVAARWFAGCAYVVVGVSPGSLLGAQVHDVSTVESWLSPYLGFGTDAPEWSMAYVPFNSVVVLVLTCEPPSPGNPIWTIRKGFDGARGDRSFRAGDIHVRGKGGTSLASPADIEMLTKRACPPENRTIGSVEVAAAPDSRAVPIYADEKSISAWIDEQRESLQPRPPVPPPVLETGAIDTGRIFDYLGQISQLGISNVLSGFAETRTREAYDAEVEEYLAEARRVMPAVLIRRAAGRGLGLVALTLRNATSDNIHSVRVELTFDSPAVFAVFARPGGILREASLPRRPLPFGKGTAMGLAFAPDGLIQDSLRWRNIDVQPLDREIVMADDQVTIYFSPVSLRPRKSGPLDDVFLAVSKDFAGKSLTARWEATSTTVSGITEGRIDIPVEANVPTLVELLGKLPGERDA